MTRTFYADANGKGASSSEFDCLCCYNPHMNKRAKKRLKETLKKEITDKAKPVNDPGFSSPKQKQERPGFIAKPAKKRG